jgi:hypothetical protein
MAGGTAHAGNAGWYSQIDSKDRHSNLPPPPKPSRYAQPRIVVTDGRPYVKPAMGHVQLSGELQSQMGMSKGSAPVQRAGIARPVFQTLESAIHEGAPAENPVVNVQFPRLDYGLGQIPSATPSLMSESATTSPGGSEAEGIPYSNASSAISLHPQEITEASVYREERGDATQFLMGNFALEVETALEALAQNSMIPESLPGAELGFARFNSSNVINHL